MLSQFVSPYSHTLLSALEFDFPYGTQAVGRLDLHSEGLLILTNDRSLTGRLLHPSHRHSRNYFVLVAGRVLEEHLERLRSGINIRLKKKGFYLTEPCEVSQLEDTAKKSVPIDFVHPEWETWLNFSLREGKNRQIRKMCKEQNLRVRRLVRVSINNLRLGDLQPGEVREFSGQELFRLLDLH